MLHQGRVVLDVSGPERKRMSVEDILPEFRSRRGYDLEPLSPAEYAMLSSKLSPEEARKGKAIDMDISGIIGKTMRNGHGIDTFVRSAADATSVADWTAALQAHGIHPSETHLLPASIALAQPPAFS